VNVLFVTLDQFRGDSYGAAGHPLVATPTLDRVAAEGVRLARHYSQAAPCAPGRAAIYTGTYQMNNRVVANGTPLLDGWDNIAYVARRAGFDPTLFGYTDQGVDPYAAAGVDDPRLEIYDGILPGFSVGLYLPESLAGWVQHLRAEGYDVPSGWFAAMRSERERPASLSLSAFLTDRFLEWLTPKGGPWFAHLSYLRPHMPYAAAGEYAALYDPADVEMPLVPRPAERNDPALDIAPRVWASAAPANPDTMRKLKAQYYGMISEVDAQLGRVVAALEERGEWDDTLVVITSDHGDQLGDHGQMQKLGYFPQSYHIVGLWRNPYDAYRGAVVSAFTENVDLLPTLAATLGLDVPAQCDGRDLAALFADPNVEWRHAAHYEWDFREFLIGSDLANWPTDRTLSRQNLAVSVADEIAYVQFGDGTFRCFDLLEDPSWRVECRDADRVLAAAQEQLVWRQEHLRRDVTDMLLAPTRPGRWPRLGGLDAARPMARVHRA